MIGDESTGRIYFSDMSEALEWYARVKELTRPTGVDLTADECRALVIAATGKPVRFGSIRDALRSAVAKLEAKIGGDDG